MPPSWSSRLLSSTSSSSNPSRSNNNDTHNASNTRREKPLPQTQQQSTLDLQPTLRPERATHPPIRPHTASGNHTHGRSVSGPLPKIFSRKKSARDLCNDTDVPLDDDLVPVLDEQLSAPTRVTSGKRGKQDDDGKIMRRCMCCDSRVNVPLDLDRFRCLACLTINELGPASAGQSQKGKDKQETQSTSRAVTFPGGLPPDIRTLPLSVQRTRAIIDRCLVAYLEARCRRQNGLVPPSPGPEPAPMSSDLPAHLRAVDTRDEVMPGQQLSDSPIALSLPDISFERRSIPASRGVVKDPTDLDSLSLKGPNTQDVEVACDTANLAPSSPGSRRKPIPPKPSRKPPPPPMALMGRRPSDRDTNILRPSGLLTPKGMSSPVPAPISRLSSQELEQRRRCERVKTIFRPLEDYVVSSFGYHQCLNTAFSTLPPKHPGRARSESNILPSQPAPIVESEPGPFDGFSELDAKTLLLGELGENSLWWTGKLDRLPPDKEIKRKKVGEGSRKAVSSRSPNIDWVELDRWYHTIHSAGEDWTTKVQDVKHGGLNVTTTNLEGLANELEIEEDIAEARNHATRALLKTTETLLKRPLKALKEPENLRFLLILLANPSLYPASSKPRRAPSDKSGLVRAQSGRPGGLTSPSPKQSSPVKSSGRQGCQHSGLLKRIFGLLANSSDNCHRYMINWFARFDEDHFVRTTDLVASFVTYRITRRTTGRPRSRSAVDDGGLIPDLSGSAMNTSAQLFSAMGLGGSIKKRTTEGEQETEWATDWQTKAAAKLMSLLFAANNIRQDGSHGSIAKVATRVAPPSPTITTMQAKAKRGSLRLHASYFYNSLLDYHDMIADFKVWESKRDKFAFCQYPLFISMGTKIKILEYDARRQMEVKAREAYFDQVVRQRAIDGYFHLRVRRDCLVEDSLQQISEAVGTGQEELKKGLRVHFKGEEGVDAGGPRKEWFLMLIRDIFDPNHGLFVYDEDSNTCYFNPNSFETSDQYYLVGALLGLAIYNSTILDIALPPFAFRKLLAAAPSTATTASTMSYITSSKGPMAYTVADLAEFRPSLAAGLQQLLDFEGDVETTYCRDFVAPVERYDTLTNVPLIPNGEATAVTNANRHEFVEAYIRYLLDTSVTRQFEPFKRGFFTVCAGNALSLFRAEEIELLVRGSDEALNVDSLRAVAVYENWREAAPPHALVAHPADTIPVLGWFWETFAQAPPGRQRQLLTFMTGSDRIPAVGATSLILRIVAGGDGWGGGGAEERARFPVARTCFNMLVLWRYEDRSALQTRLWRAVEESEGFGLK